MENEDKNTVAEERAKYGRVDVIAEWKRRRAEDIRQFEELQNDPEYQQRMAKLKGKKVINGITMC